MIRITKDLLWAVIVLAVLAVSPAGAHPHGLSEAGIEHKHDAPVPVALRKGVILGQDPFRFELVPAGLELPRTHREGVQHYHGLAVDAKGRIYVAYHTYPKRRGDHTRAVARFHANFAFDRFLGTRSWADGEVHGLSIYADADGKEWILLVNNDGRVIHTDLDGTLASGREFHWAVGDRPYEGRYRPTDATASPDAPTVVVADGYGSNKAHLRRKKDGGATGVVWGSHGKGDGQFRTNHGVGYDARRNLFLFADRENSRLVYYTLDHKPHYLGKKLHQVALPGYRPCNVSFWDKHVVVPALNARVAILGPDNKVVSSLDMPDELKKAGVDGIHDAVLTSDGKHLIIGVWQAGGRPAGTLTLWRRLPASQ